MNTQEPEEVRIENLIEGDYFVPQTGDPYLDQPWAIGRIERQGSDRLGFARALYKFPNDPIAAITQREGTSVHCFRKPL